MAAEIRHIRESKHHRANYIIEVDGTPEELDAAKLELFHDYAGYGVSFSWPAMENHQQPIDLGGGRWRAFGSRSWHCD